MDTQDGTSEFYTDNEDQHRTLGHSDTRTRKRLRRLAMEHEPHHTTARVSPNPRRTQI